MPQGRRLTSNFRGSDAGFAIVSLVIVIAVGVAKSGLPGSDDRPRSFLFPLVSVAIAYSVGRDQDIAVKPSLQLEQYPIRCERHRRSTDRMKLLQSYESRASLSDQRIANAILSGRMML